MCAAGVDVETTRDAELRLACHEAYGIAGAIPCAKRAWPVPERPRALGELEAALEAIGANRCPTCRNGIEGQLEVGGVIYAMPCRHALRTRGPK
jgi:hypothetical protein